MEYAPLFLTIKTAVVATVVTFFLGIGLALAVARMRRFQGLADAVITLPLVLPPTVVGFFLLLAFGRRSAIGKFLLQFDVTIVFTWKAAVIAAIACLIALALERHGRALLGAALALLLCFAVGGAAMDAYTDTQIPRETIEQNELPKLHYIAMGLPIHEDEGYGQYGDGGWLKFSTRIKDPDERRAALRTQVIDRVY